MPIRFLRPGLTTSERWNGLSWMAQSFYVRLLTLVDDHGRYDANPRLLLSHAFPLSDQVTTEQVRALCDQLAQAQLIGLYQAEGKPYLYLTKWRERVRTESKFPKFRAYAPTLSMKPLILTIGIGA